MAALADLAALAADVPPSVLPLEACIPRDKEKRKRSTALEAAQAKVTKAQSRVLQAQGKMEKLQSSTGLRTSPKKQLELDDAAAKLSDRQAELGKLESTVLKLQDTARLSEEAATAKKKALEEKAENNKTLTEMAIITIVELRLKYQARFDNSSDKNSAAWEHIHNDYMKKVSDHTLAESDRLTSAQLQRRWGLEYGEYKLWCAVANRAVNLSGVSADDVEEQVRACR
jgi:hypothetical protein